VIYAISFVDQRLESGTHSIQDNIKVYMAWTSSNRQVHNLTCPGSVVYQCPTTSDALMVSGELFIGINFTAIALAFKNSTKWEQSLHGNTGPMLIRFQYDTLESAYSLLWNEFLLFPNVHIWATLAITHTQTMTNEKKAALGLQKVGRDAQNIFRDR